MNRTPAATPFLFVFLLVSSSATTVRAWPSQPAQGKSLPAVDVGQIELGIGGTGGVYFLAEPGELTVDVEKRDRNARGRRTDLRAILVGPDRQVLQDVTIPDDGEPKGSGLGPAQRVRLSTRVERKGVFGLNVTVSQDRYGDCIVWGFRTNCPRYLIETSRGHRDRAHEEPIVLLNPAGCGNVCFLPRRGAFDVELAGLPAGDAPSMLDGSGALVHTFEVGSDGKAAHTFPADDSRGAVPWRLHLPAQKATVQIDGVTRWQSGDLYPNLSYWTPDAGSFFPFQAYRWLLTPYRRTVFGRPGESGEMTFQVHNNTVQEKTIALAIEFPGEPWPAKLSADRVVVRARRSTEVRLNYTMPAEGHTRVCHVRATPVEDPDFSTYSTLTVKGGQAPATKPLEIPLALKPYEHENEQFGYLSDYPVENQMYHDLENRPFARVGGNLATLRDGEWVTTDLRTAVRSSDPKLAGRRFAMASTKIAFDRAGDVYVLGTTGGQAALLRSTDGGKSFSACAIPGRKGQSRAFDVEQFSGHNVPEGPPPVLRYTRTASDPDHFWRKIHDLELFLPEKTADGGLTIGEPILISKLCIGLAAHSGIPASVVSRGSQVHVVWGEATDPKEKVPGVPAYVATYDRQTHTLGTPALVGYGPPANDIHNSPSLTIDSQGYLHVLAGTHGQPFPYARSLKPNDAHAGWTEAELTGEGLRQTYIGLVCGPDDTLHAVFRLWWFGAEPHPASHHATLAYQRKRPGQPWEKPRVLIQPPFSEYSVFYHRLTIDRLGRLFLSYDYWSTYWFYRTDHRGSRRSVIMSPDGGETWKLPQTGDLQ